MNLKMIENEKTRKLKLQASQLEQMREQVE